MIVGIEGGLGTGKTIMMIRYLRNDQLNGRPIFANLGLFDIPYKPLDVLDILKMNKEKKQLKNVSIGIDEFTVFADCRRSSSRMNLLISYFVLQTRKRNVTLYFTSQDFNMLDWRLMAHTKIQIICDDVYTKDGKLAKDYKHFTVMDLRNKRRPLISRFIMNISPYYGFYDTDETILPPL